MFPELFLREMPVARGELGRSGGRRWTPCPAALFPGVRLAGSEADVDFTELKITHTRACMKISVPPDQGEDPCG